MKTLGKIFTITVSSIFLLVFLGILGGILAIVAKIAGGEDGAMDIIKTDRAVAVVELEGEMLSSKEFSKALRKQVDNEKVKAVVVRIDSPGGAVGAAEEIFYEIKAANEKKPVVCSLGTIAASGGFYAAMGCQKIVTNKGTLTGSIGVILASPNVSKLMQRFDVNMNVIKSGALKDAGSPFRDMTENDRNYLQSVINEAYEQFVTDISTSRNISVEKVKEVADGRVILGMKAVELGLADSIGGIREAANLALQLASIEGEPEVIFPREKGGLMSLFSEQASVFIRHLSVGSNSPQLLSQLYGW